MFRLLTDYLSVWVEQVFQILLFHVRSRQIPNKNPSLQISRIITAAGAWITPWWWAAASSARHNTIPKGWFLSLCVSNAWKRLVCSLITVFKLSSTILKHVSELREEIKLQRKCCGKFSLKSIWLVKSQILPKLLRKKRKESVRSVQCVLQFSSAHFHHWILFTLTLHWTFTRVRACLELWHRGYQCIINAEYINNKFGNAMDVGL